MFGLDHGSLGFRIALGLDHLQRLAQMVGLAAIRLSLGPLQAAEKFLDALSKTRRRRRFRVGGLSHGLCPLA